MHAKESIFLWQMNSSGFQAHYEIPRDCFTGQPFCSLHITYIRRAENHSGLIHRLKTRNFIYPFSKHLHYCQNTVLSQYSEIQAFLGYRPLWLSAFHIISHHSNLISTVLVQSLVHKKFAQANSKFHVYVCILLANMQVCICFI